MKKIRMCFPNEKTFREGFEEYILDCKARNLRDGTINHYQESIKQIYKRRSSLTICAICSQRRFTAHTRRLSSWRMSSAIRASKRRAFTLSQAWQSTGGSSSDCSSCHKNGICIPQGECQLRIKSPLYPQQICMEMQGFGLCATAQKGAKNLAHRSIFL